MRFFESVELKKGQVEDPLRARTVLHERDYRTIVNFGLCGDVMELTGSTMPPLKSHDPVPPPFHIGDTAIVAARHLGDGLYEVLAMSVPRIGFNYGDNGRGFRVLYILVLLTSFLIAWSGYQTGMPVDDMAIGILGILAANILFGYLAMSSYAKKAAVRMVQEAAR